MVDLWGGDGEASWPCIALYREIISAITLLFQEPRRGGFGKKEKRDTVRIPSFLGP